MGVYRQFPYSNFHEMNMDEIIKIVKNMLEEWAQYYAEWDAWMAEINADWSNYQNVMNEAWQNMQNFINNYFDNLDVQEEINHKLTAMKNSGELATIIQPYIPSEVAAWLAAHIMEPVGVVIDTSLSVSGACADAKATGDAINNTKNDINDIDDIINELCGEETLVDFEWIEDSYVTELGVITPYEGWKRTDYIPINGADVIQLYATSSSNTQLYNCWYDSSKEFISNFLCNINTREYEPPANAEYFILSTRDTNNIRHLGIVPSFNGLMKNIGISEETATIIEDATTYQEITEFEWINNSYITEQGVITPYNGWHRTDYIDTEHASKIYLYASSSSNSQLYNAWYDENYTFIENFLCNKQHTVYEPPYNAKYFILSTSLANSVTQGVVKQSREALRSAIGKCGKECYTFTGDINSNATINTLIDFAPKIGFKCGMYAEMASAFDKVTFQFDAYSPNQIIVDDTNVTLKARFATDVVLPHGITIANNVQINVLMDNATSVKVTIASNGIQNTVTGDFGITAYEEFKIINGSTALTNVIFTMGCTYLDHNIWLFGDSYIGMTNNKRWAYYINENGFINNSLFCGSTGSGAAESSLWLNSLLSLQTPEKIVWCMGMNYASDDGAPATAWLSQVEALEDICEEKGVELILATIPSVPSLNHEYKNDYVRNSGYRYIDFAKAVDAQPDGTWISGMLSSDNVHPTELGAVALYNMAIASVPELTYN